MVASEVYLLRENDRELSFAHRPLSGVVFLLIGLGVVWFFSSSPLVKDSFARWIFSAGGAFFALVGLGAALWRYELRIDLLTRTYAGRRGFWPEPKPLRGTLDEMEGVVLTSRLDRSDKSTVTVWTVSFSFKTWDKPVKVMESQNELDAHGKFEQYAKKLQVPAIDRTGTDTKKTTWTDLDRPLAEQPGHAVSIPPLPEGSRIEFVNRPGRRSITLPALGASGIALFLVFFGIPFFGMGAFAFSQLFSGRHLSGSIVVGYIVSFVFILVGMFIVFVGIAVIRGRQVIEEDGGRITYGLLLFGKLLRPKRLAKNEVEEVAVKPVPGQNTVRQELVIRSDREIVHVSEQGLEKQELEWLRIAVQCLVAENAGGEPKQRW